MRIPEDLAGVLQAVEPFHEPDHGLDVGARHLASGIRAAVPELGRKVGVGHWVGRSASGRARPAPGGDRRPACAPRPRRPPGRAFEAFRTVEGRVGLDPNPFGKAEHHRVGQVGRDEVADADLPPGEGEGDDERDAELGVDCGLGLIRSASGSQASWASLPYRMTTSLTSPGSIRCSRAMLIAASM